MGLASKLQAAQGAVGASVGAPGVMGSGPAPYGQAPMGGTPSAPPVPYSQVPAASAPSPYPPNAFNASGASGPQVGPYGQQPPQGFAAAPPAYAAPYPGAPPGMPVGAPPGQQQQQQQQMPEYPIGGAPAAAGAPGMLQAGKPQGMVPSGMPGGMAGPILTKLTSIVAANQLHRFYPPQALQALATRLDSRVNFRDLAARWRMPVELALDLCSLALYDIIMFADDSGSMAFEENGERIEDLKLIGSKVAEVATLFDDDGILVRFMNSSTEGNAVRSTVDVGNLLATVQYSGLTPLATAMQSKVLQPIVYSLASSGQLQKPVLVLTITDGEPTDNPKDLVVQVIKDSRQRLAAQYGPKAVAFEFAQVGKDQRAQAFLGSLDKHPDVGNSIDCTSYFELESAEYQKRGIQLSPEMWLVKMMVGSIDPSYDEGDE